MYPSGRWDGFWEQPGFGRQSMTAFSLRFEGGSIDGEGRDIVGPFVFHGHCDATNGRVQLVKQYLGRHRVQYHGEPDGEGCIFGTWTIDGANKGPFLMRPIRAAAEREWDESI